MRGVGILTHSILICVIRLLSAIIMVLISWYTSAGIDHLTCLDTGGATCPYGEALDYILTAALVSFRVQCSTVPAYFSDDVALRFTHYQLTIFGLPALVYAVLCVISTAQPTSLSWSGYYLVITFLLPVRFIVILSLSHIPSQTVCISATHSRWTCCPLLGVWRSHSGRKGGC